ncbi:WG repeat-containing protein [bacterium]|nr:WG repeat-containing protein [bacterium]
MNNFIFEYFDGDKAKSGKYWYYIHWRLGVLFKSKYDFKIIPYLYFSFTIGEKVYITDEFGEPLFCTDIKIFNDCIEKENMRRKQEDEIKAKSQTHKIFKNKNYDYIRKVYCKDEYYIVTKDNLYALVDSEGNTIIDFKYKHISQLSYSHNKNNQLYFLATDSKTDKQGIIDINENIIIPFQYDLICNWNIDERTKTVVAIKGGKCGVINYLNNETIIAFKYENIYAYGDDVEYSPVENENGLWGIMDKYGNMQDIDLTAVKEVNGRNLKRKPKNNSIAYIPDYLKPLATKTEKPARQSGKRIRKQPITDENQLKLKL